MPFQSITLPQNTYLRQIAVEFDVPVDSLIAYNPAWRWAIIHNKQTVPKGFLLRLPYRDGYDPREVFVRNTRPAPQQQEFAHRVAATFAYRMAEQNGVNVAAEADILKMLKKPLPLFFDAETSDEPGQSKEGM